MTQSTFEERARTLVARMTLDEKISQMRDNAAAIERLGIPAYHWWNECLHGVARAGIATVFPQAIGLAASWNLDLMRAVATAISDEARAKHHEFVRQGVRTIGTGLNFWSPNINIFRDPRWGRGQETYGEDPFLTARMGVTFVKGLQGDDPVYLKLVATPKHFAVHSGPEADRHHFDAQANPRDVWETYLPAFEACIIEGQAASIMGAYSRVNGEPACASPTLLQRILRERWGFDGFVVSDCGAIDDIYLHHRAVETAAEAAALAVSIGCDLECGGTYRALTESVARGLIDEATIDTAVIRLFTARFRLGMFDPPEQAPYAQIPYDVNDAPAHRALALQAARESIVLLKNDGSLPLSKSLRRIAVVGPNADDPLVLLGNYHGFPSSSVTPLAGIRAAVPGAQVGYARGCDVLDADTSGFDAALRIAQDADVIVFVGGISQRIEGEEGQDEGTPPGAKSQGDRTRLDLPSVQEHLLHTLYATGKPVILVLLNGSALAINWADAHVPAIVEAWYPGEEGGTALAEVLFGDYNPGGRLPVTFYKSVDDLPPFEDYAMQGRTYRYFSGQPLYPFGYGLSYTTFAYANLTLDQARLREAETLHVRVDVRNTGAVTGDEVAQVYLSAQTDGYPLRWLAGFQRIHLNAGETQTVRFAISGDQFRRVTDDGARVFEAGMFTVSVGGGQPGYAEGVQAVVETAG